MRRLSTAHQHSPQAATYVANAVAVDLISRYPFKFFRESETRNTLYLRTIIPKAEGDFFDMNVKVTAAFPSGRAPDLTKVEQWLCEFFVSQQLTDMLGQFALLQNPADEDPFTAEALMVCSTKDYQAAYAINASELLESTVKKEKKRKL